MSLGFVYMCVSFAFVFYGLYRAWIKSAYTVEKGDSAGFASEMAELVFTSYDHSLEKAKSIEIHQTAIRKRINEFLAERDSDDDYSKKDFKVVWAKRVLLNLVMAGVLVACIFAIRETVLTRRASSASSPPS